jgi:hypothetical protein
MRARRAAKRQARPDHVCEACGTTFTPRRSDARFCSAACRAAKWRPITHQTLEHHPEGLAVPENRFGRGELETCSHMVGENDRGSGVFCSDTATWKHLQVTNNNTHGGSALIAANVYCDGHVRWHAREGTPVGEDIRDVQRRHGREDRRRSGTPIESRKGGTTMNTRIDQWGVPYINVSAQQNEAPAKLGRSVERIDKNTRLPFISVSSQQS